MSKSYSPSLIKGNDEKVSHPKDADRMLINIEEMQDALQLESPKEVEETVRQQMKIHNYKGDLRKSENNKYLIAFRTSKFAFEM
tara:strand:+ start:698 stop:949 length:252 start_codon:yes stop_codon:yes gene_type:complete